MAYKLQVAFSGVLGIVPHTDPNVGACVIIPNGLNGDLTGPGRVSNRRGRKSSLDDGSLERHFAFIRVAGHHVGSDDRAEMIRYLSHERVSFDLGGAGQGALALDPLHMIAMSAVSPGASKVDRSAFSTKPSSDADVSAQVVLRGGALAASQWGGNWRIPARLADSEIVGPFAYEAIWEVDGLEAPPVMVIDGFGGKSDPERITLTPVDDAVRIDISHLCQENPLRWEVDDPKEIDDLDFRWHFEVLDQGSKGRIRGKINSDGEGLPYPVPLDKTGTGTNCMFILHEDTDYSL